MSFQVINVPDLPKPGQFSHVVKKDKFVFISGQTAHPEADVGQLNPMAQGKRIFNYLKAAIEAAGGTMGDIVKMNIFLTDGEQFSAIKKLRPLYFTPPYPAITTVVVHSMVRRDLVMEIEATAILD